MKQIIKIIMIIIQAITIFTVCWLAIQYGIDNNLFRSGYVQCLLYVGIGFIVYDTVKYAYESIE